MEGNFQGDLSDVVRASGGGAVVGNASCSNFPVDQLDPLSEGFGDPFSSMRDPLLVELEGISHGGPLTSSSSSFHGDFIGEMRDERAPAAFRISCSGDDKSSIGDDQMRISCDLRGFTPVASCGAAAAGVSDGLMNPSSPRVQISSPINPPILKRRKSQAKKVVCIPAPTAVNSRQGGGEVVPSDLWAWRKYGQKPIKGSLIPGN